MHSKMVKFITRLLCSSTSSAAASHCGTGVSVFSTLYLVHTVPNLYLETVISFLLRDLWKCKDFLSKFDYSHQNPFLRESVICYQAMRVRYSKT